MRKWGLLSVWICWFQLNEFIMDHLRLLSALDLGFLVYTGDSSLWFLSLVISSINQHLLQRWACWKNSCFVLHLKFPLPSLPSLKAFLAGFANRIAILFICLQRILAYVGLSIFYTGQVILQFIKFFPCAIFIGAFSLQIGGRWSLKQGKGSLVYILHVGGTTCTNVFADVGMAWRLPTLSLS